MKLFANNFDRKQHSMADQKNASHPFARFPVGLEALLNRPPAAIDTASLRTRFAEQTVLITGAGGSIGRELSWQVAQLNPKNLILVDFSEFNLFHLEHTLRSANIGCALSFELLDIRDSLHVDALLDRTSPTIVFHAAAYKHVPMMERHTMAAFENNALATVNLLSTCEKQGVDQFIFISTDKAVYPTSVMGATKRLTEWYVRSANGSMKTKTVRFGNVFGSLGSAVPLFAEQISRGGPVTVTHPDMERFFMTVHDACSLILQTLLYDIAPIYTLRMNPPVRIVWLVERMIEMLSPNSAIDIEYIGIRAGEKIHEQLWAEEESTLNTPHRDIIGLTGPAGYSRAELDEWIGYLQHLASTRAEHTLRTALFQTDFRTPVSPKEAPNTKHETQNTKQTT